MPELAVIVPTFNERDNIIPMANALEKALAGVDFEIIFVDDDSPDGTAATVRHLSASRQNVRIIQRINRRGLASAVIEGMMASSAPYLAVIDGDMQHDEAALPEMLSKLKAEQLDVVVGTRNTGGGSMGAFSASRVKLSNLGKRISSILSQTDVSDPMSGYFLLTRSYLDEVVRSLSAVGFKVLLDMLASAKRPVRIGEVGYTFRNRTAGDSKLTATVCFEYVELVLDKLIGNWIPVRYAFFGLVGLVGMLVQFGLVWSFLYSLPFATAQAIASVVAMLSNYVLNNWLTFRVRRLRGLAWVSGLFGFLLACSVGLMCNLSISADLRHLGVPWVFASLAGIFVGSVWNYGVSSMLVWRVRRRYQTTTAPQVCAEARAAAVQASLS
jgi:dolichol-phosphate mannosyltransferase